MTTLRWIIFIPLTLLIVGTVTSFAGGFFKLVTGGSLMDTGHLIGYTIIDIVTTWLYMWIGMTLAPKKGIKVALTLTVFLLLITLIVFILLSVYANFHVYSTVIGRVAGSVIWYSYYLSKSKTQ